MLISMGFAPSNSGHVRHRPNLDLVTSLLLRLERKGTKRETPETLAWNFALQQVISGQPLQEGGRPPVLASPNDVTSASTPIHSIYPTGVSKRTIPTWRRYALNSNHLVMKDRAYLAIPLAIHDLSVHRDSLASFERLSHGIIFPCAQISCNRSVTRLPPYPHGRLGPIVNRIQSRFRYSM
jgi:hypothetical protein